MTYLVDTHWLVSFLNGRPQAVGLLQKLSEEGICVSVIVCGEVYEGFQVDPSSQRRIAQFDEFLGTVDLITLDREIARAYGRIRSQLRSHGRLIPDNDIWIAATVLAYDLILVSRDAHFDRIPELKRYR